MSTTPAPQPAAPEREALQAQPQTDPMQKVAGVAAFLESALRTNSHDHADWREDVQDAVKTLRAAIAHREAVAPRITLTGAEIEDLALFAGLVLNSSFPLSSDERETAYVIQPCPPEGVDDDGVKLHSRYIVSLDEYPEEGCVTLGDLLPAAPISTQEDGK